MSTARRGKPRYIELAEHFTASIHRGEFAIGGLLPTELEICAHFGVSRHTARAALTQLINAGLVSRRAGAGTRVLMSRSAMRYQHEVDNIEDDPPVLSIGCTERTRGFAPQFRSGSKRDRAGGA
jgi:DNA-binding GntR family transcriptional regulator